MIALSCLSAAPRFWGRALGIQTMAGLSRRWVVSIAMVACLQLAAGGAEPAPDSPRASLERARRIAVLGDSITHDGRWVAELAAWMESRSLTAEIINVGLPSETCSGLSEEGHAGGAFPRPDLAERLERVLRVVRPDTVLAMYGMNCGIYAPLDETRFAKFREGMERLHAAVEQSGATIIHLTPPVFDSHPTRGGATNASDYDAVLEAYSQWLLSKRADGWLVIDVHGFMRTLLDRKRETDPAFTFQPDSVHPDDAGQWAICRAVLAGLGEPTLAAEEEPASLRPLLPETIQRMQVLRDAYLAAAGHTRPGLPPGLAIDAAEEKAAELTTAIRSGR